MRHSLLIPGCLALGLLASLALQWHLGVFAPNPFPEPAAGLDTFPLEVPVAAAGGYPAVVWKGAPHAGQPEFRQRLPYDPVSLAWRRYTPVPAGPPVDLYLVHTRNGDDRKHHPDVCIREVAGAPEDPAGRKVLLLPPDPAHTDQPRPVQRFRFQVGPMNRLTVYYWHYTLESGTTAPQDLAQRLYRRLERPAPSVTVQASFASDPDREAFVEATFLPAVDAVLRGQLPPSARLGCDRLPIVLLGR